MYTVLWNDAAVITERIIWQLLYSHKCTLQVLNKDHAYKHMLSISSLKHYAYKVPLRPYTYFKWDSNTSKNNGWGCMWEWLFSLCLEPLLYYV